MLIHHYFVSIAVQALEEIAHAKRTLQSSTDTYEAWGGTLPGNSSFAVDGAWKIDENQTCARTKKDVVPWWMVDLGHEYMIKELIITTRSKGC